jgi:hypothetical protein
MVMRWIGWIGIVLLLAGCGGLRAPVAEEPTGTAAATDNVLTKTNTAASLQQQIETAASRPTLTPLPTITLGSESPGPAPTVTIPPGLRQVKEIDLTELVDGPPLLRGGNSVWQLGAVLFANGLTFTHISKDGRVGAGTGQRVPSPSH